MPVKSILTCFSLVWAFVGYTQCSLLSTTISVDFSADGTCAPVTVNTFTVTYTFNAPQDPANIEISFIWNDPANTVEVVNGAGLTVSNGNRTFRATATPFPYPDTGPECFFEAQAFITVAGDQCETSEQTQIVPSWNVDNENGGVLGIDPGQYRVCENTAINNLVFADASVFNCNIADNPDNPNQISRWVQFVYGTNAAPPVGRLREVSIDDGTPTSVTDASGDLVSSDTRGSGATLVTAGYFGPVEEVPFPADAPIHTTFPLSAPINAANVIGTTFQITMYNWNTCNPFNGDPLNPNYEDAVAENVLIEVIPPPNPSFVVRDGGPTGAILTEFCINSDIYFQNQTPGGPYNYQWEFFDGPTSADAVLATSNVENPTYQYPSGGPKLVRLTATDANADGICDVIFEDIVQLSPDAVADFAFYDAAFGSVIDPDFCQTGGDVFEVGFRDQTIDQPNTEFRYEFYNESNILIGTEPADGSFLPDPISDFTRTFSAEEFTIVRLVARNTSTLCGSEAQDTVFVYGTPTPFFEANEPCQGDRSSFTSIADPITSLSSQVNNDQAVLYEWDFSYDGSSFNVEHAQINNTDLNWFIDGNDISLENEPASSFAGIYTVALRMTTELGQCSGIFSRQVTVHPNPDAQLVSDFSFDICPGDEISFTNTSANASLPTSYTLEVSHGPSGFFSNTPFNTPTLDMSFSNPDDTSRTYTAIIIANSNQGCTSRSTPLVVRVLPDEVVSFNDPGYNVFNSNCSQWVSTAIVDVETRNLNPDRYNWYLLDVDGLVQGYPISKVAGEPDFHELDYQITNTSPTNQTYRLVLEAEKAGLCLSNDTLMLQISPQPDARFTLTRNNTCDRVEFIADAMQKGLAGYDWSLVPIPDLLVDNGDEIQFAYDREVTAGNDFNATIALTTENLASCTSSVESVVETIEKRRPDLIPAFALDRDELQLPDAVVSITNNTVAGPGVTYLWEFGDGNSSTQQDPGSHLYTSFGTFELRLSVTDEFCTVETSQTVTVLPTAPILDFTADIVAGCTPLTVQFTNLSQFAAPGEYLWEFGDGSVSTADNPTHTFFAGGNFTVRLRGQNEVGQTSEIQKEQFISAYARPYADFIVSTRVVYIPDQEAVFRNLSENAISYYWDFGDGTTSIESDPRHAYTEEGFYDITLIATNEFGCIDTLFRSAEVEAVTGGQVNTPNAFTPNTNGPSGGSIEGIQGDPTRINDIFLPQVEGVERFRMLVYNKWGELIFESNSKTIGWDGYYQNKLAPSGVYVYKLELRYSDGQDVIKVGDVTLIR